MEKKERDRSDDVLTNNVDIPYAQQCKTCVYRNKVQKKGDLCDPYKKRVCDIYQEKPMDIINNEANCKFYKKDA